MTTEQDIRVEGELGGEMIDEFLARRSPAPANWMASAPAANVGLTMSLLAPLAPPSNAQALEPFIARIRAGGGLKHPLRGTFPDPRGCGPLRTMGHRAGIQVPFGKIPHFKTPFLR